MHITLFTRKGLNTTFMQSIWLREHLYCLLHKVWMCSYLNSGHFIVTWYSDTVYIHCRKMMMLPVCVILGLVIGPVLIRACIDSEFGSCSCTLWHCRKSIIILTSLNPCICSFRAIRESYDCMTICLCWK